MPNLQESDCTDWLPALLTIEPRARTLFRCIRGTSVSEVLLQLSDSPPVVVCISHLHWDACCLCRPSDRNAQRHFLPFFTYLGDGNSSYRCCYKEWHFVLFSLGENVLKLTELCLRKKRRSKMNSTECVGWEGESCLTFNLHLLCWAVLLQSISNQWMNKKPNHTNSQKRDLYFLDYNKSRKQRGLQFFVLLFLPCDSLQLKNKTPAWPYVVSHSDGVRWRTR